MIALVVFALVSLALGDYDISTQTNSIDSSLVMNAAFTTVTAAFGIGDDFSGTFLDFILSQDCLGVANACAGQIAFDLNSFAITYPNAAPGTCTTSLTAPLIVRCGIIGTAVAPGSGIASIQITVGFPGCCADCIIAPMVRTRFQGIGAGADCGNGCFQAPTSFNLPGCGQE